MNKKTALTVFVIIIAAAVFLGILLVNTGDGPVMGMLLADKAIENIEAYDDASKTHDGVYLIESRAFNKYQEDYKSEIPEGKNLYAAILFVECPQGSQYTCKWIKDGNTIKEEIGTLPTGPKGVISYLLDGGSVANGSYTFELYDGSKKIYEKSFSVD